MLTDEYDKIIKDAKSRSMWIYDPSYKKWYSPEDLKHISHYVDWDEDFIKGLQIRHPNEGIEAGFKRLAETQNKLQAFINLVMNYYKK